MTRAEMLDRAARAQGWIDYPEDSVECGTVWHVDKAKAPFGRKFNKSSWKPLESDFDALRLQIALNVSVQFIMDTADQCSRIFASAPGGPTIEERPEWHHGDKVHALRYAIVRAAAGDRNRPPI